MTEQQKTQNDDQQEELTIEELSKVAGGVRRTNPGTPGVTHEDTWDALKPKKLGS